MNIEAPRSEAEEFIHHPKVMVHVLEAFLGVPVPW